MLKRFFRGWVRRLWEVVQFGIWAHVGILGVMFVMSLMYLVVPPSVTGMMVYRSFFDRFPARPTVFLPLEKIGRGTRNAFIKLEDGNFYTHWGISPGAIREAWATNIRRGRVVAGGSTITMQLSKNLFLWPDRSLVRKYFEIYGTLILEAVLSKDRILELYLNTIEFGPGVYGLQSGAVHQWGRNFSSLSLNQIFRMAAIITNPIRFNVRTMVNSRGQMARLRALGGF